MIKEITELLTNNLNALNRDKYIQLDKSVRNTDVSAPYAWIDGLQLDKETNKVTVWLSTEKSELIHPIAIERIERNEGLLKSIKEELEHTIACFKEIVDCVHDEMLLTNYRAFGDNKEHEYAVSCKDGIATAVPTESELQSNPKAPKTLELIYPKLNELADITKQKCLMYRGIYDGKPQDCTYADVCMLYGRIRVPKKK